MPHIRPPDYVQYIPRNMHTVFALLCFVVVIHWLIFPYPPGLLRWHCGNLTIAPVPAKQPWWIWINTSCEIIMNDYITTTKQSTTKPCAYFLGYTVKYMCCACPFVGSISPYSPLLDFIVLGEPPQIMFIGVCFTENWQNHDNLLGTRTYLNNTKDKWAVELLWCGLESNQLWIC